MHGEDLYSLSVCIEKAVREWCKWTGNTLYGSKDYQDKVISEAVWKLTHGHKPPKVKR